MYWVKIHLFSVYKALHVYTLYIFNTAQCFESHTGGCEGVAGSHSSHRSWRQNHDSMYCRGLQHVDLELPVARRPLMSSWPNNSESTCNFQVFHPGAGARMYQLNRPLISIGGTFFSRISNVCTHNSWNWCNSKGSFSSLQFILPVMIILYAHFRRTV